MLASDGNYYAVKFRNNPQDVRVLANELFVSRLAEKIDLPVPRAELVEVSTDLIAATPELRIQLPGRQVLCESGAQVGSRYILQPAGVFDFLPEALFPRLHNREAFAGMLAFDAWLCNTDYRQALFIRLPRRRKYAAVFIDNGHCFNQGAWDFPDAPLRGLFITRSIYDFVSGWPSFDPWLASIESLDPAAIYCCARDIPPEWYGEPGDLERLIGALVQRRHQVRRLLYQTRCALPMLFPSWSSS